MSDPTHMLALLADDIKLSLLERQRHIAVGLEPDAQNGNISRSLESMRTGIESLEADAVRLEGKGDGSAEAKRADAQRLRTQYDDLTSQFHGFPTTTTSSTAISSPAPASAGVSDGIDANPTPAKRLPTSPAASKSVRFRDSEAGEGDAEEAATRAALFPYRDDPSALEAQTPDQTDMSNTQIYQYHDQVMADQDEQLDRLGESIGRQRQLGMMIGDELDDHVQMLDEVDGHVDRQQGRINNARDRIGRIARRANENKQLTTIIVLIVILVLLILVLKT